MNILDYILIMWNFGVVFYTSQFKNMLATTLNEILIMVTIIFTIVRIFVLIYDKFKNNKVIKL
jgi:hypothetical protein